MESFQAFDEATKEGASKVLVALRDNRDRLIVATDAQTKQMREMHAQAETVLSQEFELAAANLAEQSETTRTLTAKNSRRLGHRYSMPSLMQLSGMTMLFSQAPKISRLGLKRQMKTPELRLPKCLTGTKR